MKFSKFNLIVPDEKTGKIILFNTLQGSCIEIDEATKKNIENNKIDSGVKSPVYAVAMAICTKLKDSCFDFDA